MKQSKKTKKMLISGVVSLVLCLAMLVGSTLAWFTDTINVTADMQVGTFKVALQKYIDDEYQNIGTKEGDTTYTQSDEPVFGGTNWAPGQIEVNYLAVVNKGTMPLNYDMLVNVTGDLVGALEYAIIDGVEAGSNDALDLEDALVNWDRVKAAANGQAGDVAEGEIQAAPNGHLEIGETDYFALVIYMKEEADNSYQGKSFSADVVLNARQVNYVEVVEEPEEPFVDPFADYIVKKEYDFENNFTINGWMPAGTEQGVIKSIANSAGSVYVAEDGENHYCKIERVYDDATRPASWPGEIRIRAYEIQAPVADEDVVVYSFDIAEFTTGASVMFGFPIKILDGVLWYATTDAVDPVEVVDLTDGKWHNVAIEVNFAEGTANYYGDGELIVEGSSGAVTAPLEYLQIGQHIYGFPATPEADKTNDVNIGIDNIKVMVPSVTN